MRRGPPPLPALGLAFLLVAAPRAAAQAEPREDEGAAPRIEARPLQGLKAEVAALILGGGEGGELWAAALAAPFPGEAGKWNVDFWIEIDGGRLLGTQDRDDPEADADPDAAEALRVEVHAYAVTSAGTLEAHSSDSFRLPAELGQRLAEGGVKYGGRLEVRPGAYDLRILVRERQSERFVLRVLPVDVPGPEEGRAVLLPPLFTDVEGAWIEVAGSAPPASPYSPAALPVLAAGRPATARLRISAPDGEAPVVHLRALDAERRPVGEIAAELDAAPRTPFPELDAVDMKFELPDDLLTGNYLLEATLDREPAAHGEPAARWTSRVFVLGLEREERDVVWTDLQRLASLSERRREALDLAAKRRAAGRVAAIAEAYRGVLERVASGSIEEAAGELVGLESEVLDTGDSDAPAWLANAENGVIAELAGVDAECLVPVLQLHMEGHGRATGENAGRLAFYTRERVLVAAKLYAEKSTSELAPILAAAALSDLGTELRGARMSIAARRMMEEALALDDRNLPALLGLGLDHERGGEYAEAARYLERLVELDPGSEEGRLRLALSLRRAGDAGDAARHLRRLIDDGATPWLLALAYQELARILAGGGEFARAASLLEAGLARLPGESRLYIQLAWVLDRMGESRRARETIRSTPAGTPAAGTPAAGTPAAGTPAAGTPDSPRLRYSRDAGGDVASGRPALARQSMARLAVLARALSKTGKEP